MDFVARAKALFNNKAAIGLIVVPLAAAVPALAGSISTLPISNPACSYGDGLVTSGSCASPNVSQLSAVNGIAGVSFSGPTSGYTFLDLVSPTISDCGTTACLYFYANGTLSGSNIPAGTTVPLLYDFNISGSGSGSITGWELGYDISTIGGSVEEDIFSPNLNFTGQQSGSANLQLTTSIANGDNVALVVFLLFNVTTSSPDFTVNVSVPDGSFDFNNTSSTPEPSSGGLAGLSIALSGGYLLFRGRRGFVLAKEPPKP